MQIPRGTFRALQRGRNLHALISELQDSAFHGYCKMAFRSSSITLVFEKGTIQLAEYNALKGDAALEQILQSGSVTVDAVLHDLSPVQLLLAVEFSPLCVVHSEMLGISTDQQGIHDAAGNNSGSSQDLRKIGVKEELRDPGRRPVHAAPDNIPKEQQGEKGDIPCSQATDDDDDASLLSRELDALDAMDIESMAAKFRANYRLMMERLELEHLIELNAGKDTP